MDVNYWALLASVVTVILGVSAILGAVGKYILLPWLDRRVAASIKTSVVLNDLRDDVGSLQRAVAGFADVTTQVAEIISQLESAKKKLSEMNPYLERQREELEQKISALRMDLRRTQGALVQAASSIAQDVLRE